MEHDISFNCNGFEMMRLCSNGDIFVQDELVTNDKMKAYFGFRAWLKEANMNFGNSSIVSHTAIGGKKRG